MTIFHGSKGPQPIVRPPKVAPPEPLRFHAPSPVLGPLRLGAALEQGVLLA